MENSVCFIGHRKITNAALIYEKLLPVITELITGGTVNFIFGDHSEFNTLCYNAVTELKKLHPHIKRIKFRRDHEVADSYTLRFLNAEYEENVAPEGIGSAGRSSYVLRNQAMIQESEVCIFYYDSKYLPPRRKNSRSDLTDYQPKSGTAAAYSYAVRNKKKIYNLY